jgi:hypothetical protein
VESASDRRHFELKEYSGSRQYTLHNLRFGKQAEVAVEVRYRSIEGKRYVVLARSGSGKLNGIVDQVLASEANASLPLAAARHDITAVNYRVRLLGTDFAGGRRCFLLRLEPRSKSQFLIVGRAWIDAESYGVVRIDGQFAASMSILVGAPHIIEDFVEVEGFWLPLQVRSVTSSFLLGPTELDIFFSNYRIGVPLTSLQ